MAALHTPPAGQDPVIVQAGEADTGVLAQLIADAFHDLAVSQWLVADPAARRAIYPAFFRMHVEHALADGVVHTTAGRVAAAVWIATDGLAAPADGYAGRLAAITGPQLGRFMAFDETLARHHPAGVTHHHLAILAVHPDWQHLGIGTALLDAHHAFLDEHGLPAYLEAASTGTRDLYRRHGYELQPDSPIRLPAGPDMWPMWRVPRTPAADPPAQAKASPDLMTDPETL